MKLFFSFSIFLLSLPAFAGNWLNVQTDHAGFPYSQGDKAEFQIQALSYPTSAQYRLKVTIEFLGVAAPVEILLQNGWGRYLSPSLAIGNPAFKIVTHIISIPPAASYDQVVEQTTIPLPVVLGGGS